GSQLERPRPRARRGDCADLGAAVDASAASAGLAARDARRAGRSEPRLGRYGLAPHGVKARGGGTGDGGGTTGGRRIVREESAALVAREFGDQSRPPGQYRYFRAGYDLRQSSRGDCARQAGNGTRGNTARSDFGGVCREWRAVERQRQYNMAARI